MIATLAALLLQTASLPTVPEAFRGDWAEAAEDCGFAPLRTRIDALGVARGASVRHPARADELSLDGAGLHWSFVWNDVESGVWVTRYSLAPPEGDRMTLTRDGKDGLRTFNLVRCTPAPAAGG